MSDETGQDAGARRRRPQRNFSWGGFSLVLVGFVIASALFLVFNLSDRIRGGLEGPEPVVEDDATDDATDSVEDVTDDTTDVVEDVTDDTTDIVEDVTDGATDIVEDVTDGATDIVEDVTDNTTDVVEDVTDETTDIVEDVTDDTTDVIEDVTDETTDIVEDVTDETTDVVEDVTDETTDIVEDVTDDTTDIVEDVTDETTDVVEDVTDETSDVVEDVTDETTDVVEDVTDETTDIVEDVTDDTTDIVEDVTDETTDIVEDVTDETTDTVEDVTDDTTDIVEDVTDDTTDIVEDVTDETTDIVEDVTDDTTDIVEDVTDDPAVERLTPSDGAQEVVTDQFDGLFSPTGVLVPGSGRGSPDETIYAPDMRFPLERSPAYANSQVFGVGGFSGPRGGQCDRRNYAFPWFDNFCESRSRTTAACPSGRGHQGQDIRPATCEDSVHWAVAAEDGRVVGIGTFSVTVQGESGRRYLYLHLNMNRLAVRNGARVTRGQRIGLVSNFFGRTATTIHLHFEIRIPVRDSNGVTRFRPVPTYGSLIDSYRRLVLAGL